MIFIFPLPSTLWQEKVSKEKIEDKATNQFQDSSERQIGFGVWLSISISQETLLA